VKKEFFKYIDDEGKEIVRMKIQTDGKKVTDILVQYDTFLDNKWTPIIRYDCAHGYFHKDVLNPKGNKEKHTIVIQNLEDALLYAEQDIKDRWKFYKTRYVKKLNNEKRRNY